MITIIPLLINEDNDGYTYNIMSIVITYAYVKL